MEDALAIVGGFFIVSAVVSFYIDNRRPSFASQKSFSVEGLIRFLGVIGMIVLFCVGFGLVSWLISAIYWFVIESAARAF